MNISTNSSCLYSKLLQVATSAPADSANNSTTLDIKDDHYGAMLFTVATVSVYGISIVFFIAGHLRKRQINKDEENQISHYLKRLYTEELDLQNRQYHVVRLKSRMLVDSALGQRHDRRTSLLPRHLGVSCVQRERSMDDIHYIDSDISADNAVNNHLGPQDLLPAPDNNSPGATDRAMAVAPWKHSRVRRYGRVDIGGSSSVDGGSGYRHGTLVPGRSHLMKNTLPSIEEDAQSMYSVDSVSVSQRLDSCDSQTPIMEHQFLDSGSSSQQEDSTSDQSDDPIERSSSVQSTDKRQYCDQSMNAELEDDVNESRDEQDGLLADDVNESRDEQDGLLADDDTLLL